MTRRHEYTIPSTSGQDGDVCDWCMWLVYDDGVDGWRAYLDGDSYRHSVAACERQRGIEHPPGTVLCERCRVVAVDAIDDDGWHWRCPICRLTVATPCRYCAEPLPLAEVCWRPECMISIPPEVGYRATLISSVMGSTPQSIAYPIAIAPGTAMWAIVTDALDGRPVPRAIALDVCHRLQMPESVALVEQIERDRGGRA